MKKELTKAMRSAREIITLEKQPNRAIQLIQGDFVPTEAADILLSFINDKIKFHTVKQLNLAKDSPAMLESTQRVKELKSAKNKVTDLIVKAQKEGCILEIESGINILLKKKKN